MKQSELYQKSIASPVGKLILTASDKGLCAVEFEKGKHKVKIKAAKVASHPVLDKAEAQLSEYFSGKRRDFDIKLDPQGTIFQLKAWKELQKIPYGKTISYGEQAKRIGDAKKARAVGMANGRNPISIIVPCHRVIGASGALTGFGGGVDVKQKLLELEQQFAA